MEEPELLTKQRQALRAFCQTAVEMTRQEAKGTKRVEAGAVKARDDARTRTSQAQGWLKEARNALNAGRETLGPVNSVHLLGKKDTVPVLRPGANTGVELECSAATARRAATGIEQSVQALQQWREARTRLRKRLVGIAVAAVLVCMIAAIVAITQYTAMLYSAATSQPTATPIPGWEKFECDGVELWLPESYEGVDLSEEVGVIIENLRRLGPDFEQMAQMIEQNPSMYVVWAFDSEVGDSGSLTNVAVTTEKVLSAVTIDTYLDAASKQLPAQFQVVERDIVSLGNYRAGRLVIEATISGVASKVLMYAVKDGNTMWLIVFATGAEEFDQRLSVFEQSALTFAIQP